MVEPEVFSLNDEAVVLLPELFVQLYPVPLPGGRGGEPGSLSPNTRSAQLTNQLGPFLTLENSKTETHLVRVSYRVHQVFIQCLGLVEFILQCLHLLADDHQTLSFTL